MSVNDKMKAIADAIRAHTGGTDALTLDAMAQAIAGIQAGGGGGDILGHKFAAGSFTLTEETTSTYNILDANQLFAAIKDDFPGATALSNYVKLKSGSSSVTLERFLIAACWIDATYDVSRDGSAKEWLTSFLPRCALNSSNNMLAYGDSYGYFAARSGSSNGVKIDYSKGLTVGFGASYKGLAGSKYNWLVIPIDHGEVV